MQVIRDFIVFFSLLSYILLSESIIFENPNHTTKGNESDYEALLAIKAQISEDPNSVLSSWNNSLHLCQWGGITCDLRHWRVVSLDLSSSRLAGTLSPFIGNLTFLHGLNLTNNFFRGDIPHQISYLPRLQKLDLSSNSFEGEIPANLSLCLHLKTLYLDYNKLEGRIPTKLLTLPKLAYFTLSRNSLSGRLQDIGIGNVSSSLCILDLGYNNLQGRIPDDIGRLKSLVYLLLGYNMLSGTIPTSLFNLSSLTKLVLGSNQLYGHLPQDLGVRLPQLQYLFLHNLSLSGQVPTSLSNLSELLVLTIANNIFEGGFVLNGNHLPRLKRLDIGFAFSTTEHRDLGFVDTLTNCTNLEMLLIGGNSFTGTFPRAVLNLSTDLRALDLMRNHISGQIPVGLGKFVNLMYMRFNHNNFTGLIPADIGKLKSMEILIFIDNNFSGEIPFSLGNLTHLSVLSVYLNNLEGSIPISLGNCQSLQEIYLSFNKLTGLLPSELFNASSLQILDVSQNNLQGSLGAEIRRLKNLDFLDVSHNRFSGEIPINLKECMSLTVLEMSKNSFLGSIPNSLSPLKGIKYLDLSCNNLSGQIPSYFSSWPYLSFLNLSFNNLEGEVPASGVFANISVVSVVGNSKLCGGVSQLHLRRCPLTKESKNRRLSAALIVVISIACVIIVVFLVAICFYFLRSQRKTNDTSSGLQNIKPFLEVSYQMLLRATNGFSPSNLLGVGGFGSVYKGILHQDDTELVVAVKVMKLQNEGAGKSFLAECKALRNIRHRNLVKIITACSSIDAQRNDFKSLIYEFIPRGSLEGWLYSSHVTGEQVGDSQPSILSLFQRLNIAIDVASALEYLHLGCANPLIHCDLKPSNILLDDEMTARIGDFGLSKFLSGASSSGTTNQSSSTQVRGTVGYAAPEYGLGSKVSPEGDIYSFGIIVLEIMTSKKPTDPMFINDLNLHGFSNSALPDQVMEIIDQRMLGDADVLYPRTVGDIRKIECIKSLIMIGVHCSMALPQERMSISNALNELKSARQNILTGGPKNQISTQC